MSENLKKFNSGQNSESGSGVVEFLITFPMFLILCLFLVELTFICIDRHVIRLASFEGARTLSLGAKSDANYNPCTDPQRLKKAKNTVYKRVAAIAPTADLMLAKSDVAIPETTPVDPVKNKQSDVLTYFLRRWPSAVVLTDFNCAYDNGQQLVTLTVKYNRVLATPIINRVVFYLRQAQFLNSVSGTVAKVDLDDNFMALKGNFKSPLSSKNLQTIVPYLKNLPGMSILSFADKMEEHVNSIVEKETAAVDSVLALVPEVMWQLPLSASSTVAVGVKQQGTKIENGKLKTPTWSGLLPGATSLTGDHRKWAQALSTPSEYLNNKTKEQSK